MNIRFNNLILHNFKAHRDLDVEFGDLTKITADNACGKTSILEAIPFIFYGLDTLGSKFDPTPLNYDHDYVNAQILVSIDEKNILLGRGIEKGKATYYINEVPSKATEFDDLIKSLFDKELFLSLFNPSYFFTLKWDEQRSLILRNVTAPANKEVFKQLPDVQGEKLAELVRKHSLTDLDKIHRDNKNKQDKAYIAAQSRIKTLQEQLDRLTPSVVDIEATRAEIARLDEQIKALQQNDSKATEAKLLQLQTKYDSLLQQIKVIREQHSDAKNQEPNTACSWCGQELDERSKKEAIKAHLRHCKVITERANKMIAEALAIKVELTTLRENFEPVEMDSGQLESLLNSKAELQEVIREKQQREQLEQQVKQAKADEAATLASRNESIFILDAIKAYLAKEAELMAAKVQDMFTTLSLRLFKVNKTDGEIKPDFEIEMDGKPYRKLSLSEGIRAGLELREVLSQQSGIVAPCFVDNAESITRFKQPTGQLITCRVMAGQELKIETEAQSE